VPEDHGVFEDEGADPAFFPIVDIAAADAGVVYGYEDIVGRFESGNWLFGERYVVGLLRMKERFCRVSCQLCFEVNSRSGVCTLSVFVCAIVLFRSILSCKLRNSV